MPSRTDSFGISYLEAWLYGRPVIAARTWGVMDLIDEGHDGLFASRLCGQYSGYLHRRLAEAAAKTRGDADAVMQGVVDAVPADELDVIVAWLAVGKGCTAP